MLAAVLITAISNPWRKYNEFFDNGCKNIWGLSPVIKFTYLYFGLIIPYIFISTILPLRIQTTIEGLFSIGTFLTIAIWALYFPVLSWLVFIRVIKKTTASIKKLSDSLSLPKNKLLNANIVDVLTTMPSISNIFVNMWLARKPDRRTATEFDLFLWVLKFRTASFYFKCTNVYFNIITLLTAYYPFSMLFANRIYHARHKKLNELVTHIETIARKARLEIVMYGNEAGGLIYEFNAGFTKPRTKSNLKKLEQLFQKKFGTVYIRKGDAKLIRIIIPTEIMDLYIGEQ